MGRSKSGNIVVINMDGTYKIEKLEFENYQQCNRRFHELIGNGCDCYQTVDLKIPLKFKDARPIMLCDEDGMYHNLSLNCLGTLLHWYPILGNILIVSVAYTNDDMEICGLNNEETLAVIELLENVKFSLENAQLDEEKTEISRTNIVSNK